MLYLDIKEKISTLKIKTSQVYVALKHKKTPWYAKVLAYITIAYALSPIDLIPDFIPVLGYLDDLVILPLLIFLTIKLIPSAVWLECEDEAKLLIESKKEKKWYYAIPIILIWLFSLLFIIWLLFFKFKLSIFHSY